MSGARIATIREEPGHDAVGGHWASASGGDLEELVSMTALRLAVALAQQLSPTRDRAQVCSVAPRTLVGSTGVDASRSLSPIDRKEPVCG
jgi:hypothetical protein